ncbi:hypothetical protein ACVWZW_001897 [Bradyrhizobium sp. F1.13.4]
MSQVAKSASAFVRALLLILALELEDMVVPIGLNPAAKLFIDTIRAAGKAIGNPITVPGEFKPEPYQLVGSWPG